MSDTTPTPSSSLVMSTEHKISFTGNGVEYFQIWLVNIALTILTLGIYGAWAKVRREQYFHSHTCIDGSSFEYTASPLSILKGRLLLFFILLSFIIVNAVFPLLGVLFLFGFFFLFPWIVTQSLKFRARYTSYRNLSFRFIGDYWLSFKYFILTRIVSAVSFWSLAPWAKHRERRYVVNGLRYGRTPFAFHADVWDFYKVYIGVVLFIVIPLFVIMGGLIVQAVMQVFNPALIEELGANPERASERIAEIFLQSGVWIYLVLAFAALFFLQLIVPIFLKTLVARVTWNNSSIGDFSISYTITIGRYLWIAISNLVLRIITFGLATPYCTVRMHRYKVENLSLWGPSSFGAFTAAAHEELRALGDEVSDLYELDIDLGF